MSWLGPLTPPESEVAMLGAVTDADRILTSLVTEPIAMVSWEGRNPATMEAPRNVKDGGL